MIRRERERRGLTRKKLAALVVAAAQRDGEVIATNERAVARWELYGVEPQPAALRALAAVLHQPIEDLTALVRQPGQQPEDDDLGGIGDVDGLWLPPGQPADHEYVEAIHATIGRLVGLEVQHGGDEVAPLAWRYFESARRRLAAGGHPRTLDRDLTAAAGELAEVAGWLAHDADHQELSRRLSVEALHLARMVGDRSIELLIMSNMAFVALFNRQPGEALMVAKAALDEQPLTNRQRVIFELRQARALAQLGAGADAVRLAERAQSRYWDGAGGEEPKWSWWIDPREVAGHVAWAYVEVGEPRTAAPMLRAAVEACPADHSNNRYFRSARLLSLTVDAGAWADAEEVVSRIVGYVGDVRSGRAVRLLRRALAGIEAQSAPPGLVEAGRHLDDVLTAAGYSE